MEVPSPCLCRAWSQSRQYPLCHTVLHQLQGIDMHNGMLLQYLYFGWIEVACADQRSCLWPHPWFQCCRKPPIFKVQTECNGIGHASQKACCGRFHSVQIPVGIEPHHSWRPLRLSKTSNGANSMGTISLEHEHKTIFLRKSILYGESGALGNASQVRDTIARALRFRQLDPNNITYGVSSCLDLLCNACIEKGLWTASAAPTSNIDLERDADNGDFHRRTPPSQFERTWIHVWG